MKRTLLLKSLLGSILLLGSSNVCAQTWEKAELSELTSDDVFVIVDATSSTALSNDKGTSSAPSVVAVTIEGSKITSKVEENIKWKVSGSNTDGYTFYPKGSTETWLYTTNSNNGVRVGTNDNKLFTLDDKWLYNTATKRWVGVYNSQDWRCYTNTDGNIKDTQTQFYKYMSESGGDVEDPTISTIATVQAGEAGTYKIQGTVVATCARGGLVYDTTGYIYVYDSGFSAAVGDKVTIEGTTSVYGEFKQFSKSNGYTLIKTGTSTVTHPTATNLDLDAWAATPVIQYVKLVGNLAIDGNYYNVTVEGKTAIGSLVSPTDEIKTKLANGEVTVYGYALYTTTSKDGKTYVNIIVTSVEGNTPVETPVSTIATVQEKGAGNYKIEGTVVANCTRGVLVYDNTGYIYIFDAEGISAAVGDKVVVEGTTSKYGGFQQFSATKGYTLTKTGTTTVTHPAAVELDLDAWAKTPVMQYVKLSGTLTVSGNHYNVSVTGKDAKGSLIYPIAEISEKLTDGSRITVYGYAIYKNTSNDVTYANIIATSVESETTTKKDATINLSTEPVTELSIGGSDSYTVAYDGDGTLKAESSNAEIATVAISGNKLTVSAIAAGSATITISAPETDNYTAASVAYQLTVTDPNVKSVTFDLTAATYNDDQSEESVTWEKSPITLVINKANSKTKANNYLGGSTQTSDSGEFTADHTRIYKGQDLVISAPEGQAVSEVSFSYTSASYSKILTPNTGAYKKDGAKGSWTGIYTVVTLTNNDASARLASVSVSYVPLTDTGKTITISDMGKATFTPDADCIIGDGTVSKYITGVEENGYTLVETDAPVVAAGEGVLLSGAAGTYKLYTHEALSASKNAANHLVGATTKTFAPKDSYILQDKGTGAKFYRVAADNTFDIQGHAYLLGFEAAPEVKVFNFAGDAVTGIQEVNEVAETEGAIYNLQGVQVNNSYKGIVIRGGKKFLKK